MRASIIRPDIRTNLLPAKATRRDLRVLWNYLAPRYLLSCAENADFFRTNDPTRLSIHSVTNEAVEQCDTVLLLGSNDLGTPQHAAQIFHEIKARNVGPMIVASGKGGHLTVPSGSFSPESEAARYQRELLLSGIPSENIIIEPESTNSGQNIRFSEQRLQALGYFPRRLLIIQSPALQLRANLTFEKQWLGNWDYYISFPPPLPNINSLSSSQAQFHLAYALREVMTTLDYCQHPALGFVTNRHFPLEIENIVFKYYEIFKDRFAALPNTDIFSNSPFLSAGFRALFEAIEKQYIKLK